MAITRLVVVGILLLSLVGMGAARAGAYTGQHTPNHKTVQRGM
jgi:hypothetical protein